MIRLRSASSPAWVAAVRGDLDGLLGDHAACERQAAMNALALVAGYRTRPALVDALILLAEEELKHYREVHAELVRRGKTLPEPRSNTYAVELAKLVRKGDDETKLVDRLLVAAVIEARSCERLQVLGEALEAPLGPFYAELARSEARHHGIYVRLARTETTGVDVDARLAELLDAEAALLARLPVHAVVHA